MSTAPRIRPVPLIVPERRLHRFSVAQYYDLLRQGILTAADRTELIEGLILDQMTKNPPHECTLTLIDAALPSLLPPDKILRRQSSLTLIDSVPEPDFAIVEGPPRRYARVHPGPRNVSLVIEVAHSSLAEDRTDMLRAYARARIPVYWIVNLVDNQIEVYTQPRSGRNPAYLHQEIYSPDREIPVVIDGREIARLAVRDLLP